MYRQLSPELFPSSCQIFAYISKSFQLSILPIAYILITILQPIINFAILSTKLDIARLLGAKQHHLSTQPFINYTPPQHVFPTQKDNPYNHYHQQYNYPSLPCQKVFTTPNPQHYLNYSYPSTTTMYIKINI